MYFLCWAAFVLFFFSSAVNGRRVQSTTKRLRRAFRFHSRRRVDRWIQAAISCWFRPSHVCWIHFCAPPNPSTAAKKVAAHRTLAMVGTSMNTTRLAGNGQEASVGAIVVPSCVSQRFALIVRGTEGWMKHMWHVTEYQAEFSSNPSKDLLHAVHLLDSGSELLNLLCKEMPQREAYNLTEMFNQNLSRALHEHGMTATDEKVLRKLSRACKDMTDDIIQSNCALWIPGLSSTSEACRRSWEDPLYEAWQLCKDASPAPRFTFVELFAGIGGFRLGLEPLGGRCVFACECNPNARATYLRNFQEADSSARPLLDATCVDTAKVPVFDILTAGFPCQSFTTLTRERKGLSHNKGQLFYEVVRVLRDCQPSAALLENVPGLLTIHDGADFRRIVSALRDVGYAVGWQTLSAEHYVPQKRVRVYIVCIRRDLYERFCQESTAEAQLEDSDHGGERVINWVELDPERISYPSVAEILETNDGIVNAYTLSEDQWAKVVAHENRDRNRFGQKRDGSVVKRLVPLDGPARTLRASYKQDFKVLSQFVPQQDSRPRFFTPREMARLMGFPDTFEPEYAFKDADEGAFYRQLGNAVVPALIQELGQRILATLQL